MKLNKYQIEALLKLMQASQTGHVYNANREDYDDIIMVLNKELHKLTQ